jgi:hypothetical protein
MESPAGQGVMAGFYHAPCSGIRPVNIKMSGSCVV